MNETYQHRYIGYVILTITLIVIGIFISFRALDFTEALPLSVMGIVIPILIRRSIMMKADFASALTTTRGSTKRSSLTQERALP